MASKYAHVDPRIPALPDPEPDAEWVEAHHYITETLKFTTLADYTAHYNALLADDKAATEGARLRGIKIDVLESLIRDAIKAQGMDAVRMNGFTWSENVEPKPVATTANLDDIVKYFKDNGMEAELNLTITEVLGRLKTFVKDEAASNQLSLEEDETTGKIVAKSKIPGVTVYLRKKLSRTK